ncbi:MAG: hypothetical protein IJR93_07185 [Treponema sp.]|nr:hypothetical protein [Treponema sp.]MBQ7166708.1 hypothetical protein [Treponema sp.]
MVGVTTVAVSTVAVTTAGVGISSLPSFWEGSELIKFLLELDISSGFSKMSDENKRFLISKVANALISLASVLVAYFFGSGSIPALN